MEDTQPEIQAPSKQNPVDRIQAYQWKKGQSGNPAGRPKGKTMKEWAREFLERMTDEERDTWLEGIPKEIIWKMSEGNPHSTEDHKVEVTLPEPIAPVTRTNEVPTDNSLPEDSSAQ